MKTYIVIIVGLFTAINTFATGSAAFAAFGGSRAGGMSRSYSAPRTSTFGGSRSSGAPATIIRPSRPVYVAPPVEVHHYHSGGSGVGNFVTGMAVGNMLSQPRGVVVAPVVEGYVAPGYGAPVIVNNGHSIFYYLLSAIFIVLIICGIVVIIKEKN